MNDFSNQSPEQLLGTSEAARLVGLSSEWVRHLADTGVVPAIRTRSGHRLFRLADLQAFGRRRKQEGV